MILGFWFCALILHAKAGKKSDAIMSRCISTAISLTWSEEQTREKGEKIAAVIKQVLAAKYASV